LQARALLRSTPAGGAAHIVEMAVRELER
jgi:hypothetical protein